MAEDKLPPPLDAIDGYAERTMPTWQRFVQFTVNESRGLRGYLWRGQRCDNWELKSRYDRFLDHLQPTKYYGVDEAHLAKYMGAIKGRRGRDPQALEQNEQQALAQHHGLITPLLDWTRSIFIPAFFAFEERIDHPGGTDENGNPLQTEYRAIFGLAADTIGLEQFVAGLRVTGRSADEQKRLDAFRESIEIRHGASDDNPNMIAQGGLFTYIRQGTDVKSLVNELYPGSIEPILTKYLIPDSERSNALIYLDHMNINHTTMFPDLYGAARHCNTMLELDHGIK